MLGVWRSNGRRSRAGHKSVVAPGTGELLQVVMGRHPGDGCGLTRSAQEEPGVAGLTLDG